MDAETLLACWEQGRRRHPLDRGLLLHALAAPDDDPDTLADRPLGERNAALLRLRQRLFGDALRSCVDCPQCGERLEFTLSAADLLAPLSARKVPSVPEIRVAGLVVRLPTTRDLASVVAEPDEGLAERRLLERVCAGNPDAADWPLRHDQIMQALDAADPCMDLAVDLNCPECSHQWSAAFDAPAFLWGEIEALARRLLDEVHTLACSYGWSEPEILGLSEVRRRAYLDRVLA
jgi:hypothetical protein